MKYVVFLVLGLMLFSSYALSHEDKTVYPIAIIGAGAAGTMAVKRAVLNNTTALLFTGATHERRISRGSWVRKVNNIPGLTYYKRAILELCNETLEEIAHSPFSHNLYVVDDSIYSIKKERDYFTLIDGKQQTYYAKYVIIATGIMDEQPLIQGSIRPILHYANGQTVAYCTICDGHRCFGKRTVVIGHSESAGAIALQLAQRYHLAHVAILTNGHHHEFSETLLKKIALKNIPIFVSPILKVLGNEKRQQLHGFLLETGERIDAEMGFIALGIRPNNQLPLQLHAKVDARGLVITDLNGESSIPNLFVIGDLRANSMKQMYTAWQHAVETVQVITQRIESSDP